MDESLNEIINKWTEIKELIDNLELDIVKNSKGNKAAGGRARKQLRSLKNNITALIRISLAKSKE